MPPIWPVKRSLAHVNRMVAEWDFAGLFIGDVANGGSYQMSTFSDRTPDLMGRLDSSKPTVGL